MARFSIFFLLALTICLSTDLAVHAQSRDGLDRRIIVLNASSHTIFQLYGSNIDRRSWGEDILGNDTIRPGQTAIVDFDEGLGYCMFDLKVVTETGQQIVKPRVNVCAATTWTFVDDN